MATAIDKEQLSGTQAKISCTVNGLWKKLDAIQWTKSDHSTVTSGKDGLTIEDGSFSGTSQTTVLTIADELNNKDTTFTCLITSNEHGVSDKSAAVNLKVFSKYSI